MTGAPYDRVRVNGETVHRRIHELLIAAYGAAGIPVSKMWVTQGSWSGASASAGTHSGAGAVDLRTWNLTRPQIKLLVHELRKRGGCAWYRAPEYGWTTTGAHIHVIFRHDWNMGMSSGAKQQVGAYDRVRNGLANNGPDYHPRPAQKWWPWKVSWTRCGTGKVASSEVLTVQRALHRYVGLDYSAAPGKWGPKTQAAWLRAAIKARKRGLNLLTHLGKLYGFTAVP